ncbi:MAG: hypothetical protein A2010_14335 [Nitrospirae bacterium GWD2_57_9]|nr:MAG: hypothetical protein A2010_14335 [Nitrospirae bacterium GWD2_57_9]
MSPLFTGRDGSFPPAMISTAPVTPRNVPISAAWRERNVPGNISRAAAISSEQIGANRFNAVICSSP